MGNCIKYLYDYDLVKKCSKCEIILLKSKFHKITKSEDRLQSQCKTCVKDYNKNFYNKMLIQNLSVVKNENP